MSKKDAPKPLPPLFNFANAGLSGMCANLFVHPMDVIKNRMQMSEKSTTIGKVISGVLHKEGILGFYAGVTAGLLRQATYTTTRLGIYNQLQDYHREQYGEAKPSFGKLVLMAATAGSCGAFVGTPADVALVRMTSDGRLPPGVMNAFVRIVREEGVTTLWRGTVATMGRATVVNISQLATYSEAKHVFAHNFEMQEGVVLHFCASMLSGIVTAFNSMPLDITKTRLQNLKTGGKTPGVIGTLLDIVKKEGVPALWKGFFPTYCRLGPHTVLVFMFNEQFAHIYRTYFMD